MRARLTARRPTANCDSMMRGGAAGNLERASIVVARGSVSDFFTSDFDAPRRARAGISLRTRRGPRCCQWQGLSRDRTGRFCCHGRPGLAVGNLYTLPGSGNRSRATRPVSRKRVTLVKTTLFQQLKLSTTRFRQNCRNCSAFAGPVGKFYNSLIGGLVPSSKVTQNQ